MSHQPFFAQPTNDQMQLLGAQLGTNNNAALASYSQMLETLDGLLGPAPRTAAQWSGFARIDWQAAERHHFTLEGIGADWNSPGGGLTRVSETYGNHSLGSSQASEAVAAGALGSFLTPNLLAVTQASAGRTIQSAHAETPSTFEQTLNQNVWGQLPQIVVDSRYGFTIGNPSRFGAGSYPDEHLYRVQESVDWVRGSLLVKAGLDVGPQRRRNQPAAQPDRHLLLLQRRELRLRCAGLWRVWIDRRAGQVQPAQLRPDRQGVARLGRQLRGLGNLPCYSYYSQTMGPANWTLSTNDWAGFATAQWQPAKLVVFSAGLRWEREQLPPPHRRAGQLRASAHREDARPGQQLGSAREPGHWQLGSAKSTGRCCAWATACTMAALQNATLETALTQTGSLNGDLNFFMRPTDNLNAGGAPPFPYVFAGEPLSLVKPGAVEFAPNFRNPEVHQAVASIEEELARPHPVDRGRARSAWAAACPSPSTPTSTPASIREPSPTAWWTAPAKAPSRPRRSPFPSTPPGPRPRQAPEPRAA